MSTSAASRRRAGKPGLTACEFPSLRGRAPGAQRDDAMRRVILSIPPGSVSTYAKVAGAAGYPGYHRQAAQLLRRDGSLLPWQRVVGAGGEIKTRYEHGDTQRRLLEAEGVHFRGERVDMQRHEFDLRPWELPSIEDGHAR